MQKSAPLSAYFAHDTAGSRFKLLAEASFEGIAVHNGIAILDVNKPICALLKYSRKELIGLPLTVLFDPQQLPAIQEKIREDFQDPYQVTCIKKSGKRFTAAIRGKSLYTPNGKLRIVAVKDITKQKEYEQHLTFQYKLSALFSSDASKDAVVKRFLKLLCTANEIDAASFYTLNTRSGQFECSRTWSKEGGSSVRSRYIVRQLPESFFGQEKNIWINSNMSAYRKLPDGIPFQTVIGVQVPVRNTVSAGCLLYMRAAEPKRNSILKKYAAIASQFGSYLEKTETGKELVLAHKAAFAAPLGIFIVTANGLILWQNHSDSTARCAAIPFPEHRLPTKIRTVLRQAVLRIAAGDLRFSAELPCTGTEANDLVYEIIITPLAEKSVSTKLRYVVTMSDISAHKKLAYVLNRYSGELQEEIKKHKQELSAAYQKILSQQETEQELVVAGAIQQGLLPQTIPAVPGWEIAAKAVPANATGGDLYDVIEFDKDTYYIITADISGKGITAALFTSAAKAVIREKIQQGNDPGTIAALVNKSLYEDLSHIEMFITLFILKMDIKSNTLTYANAGHTRTIIIRQHTGKTELLGATTVAVGILPELDSVSRTCRYDPGSCIVLYSDGFTEALNPALKFYGETRLAKRIRENARLAASALVEAIFDDNRQFRGTQPQADDCTLVILKSECIRKRLTVPPVRQQTDTVISEVKALVRYLGSDFMMELELICAELFTNILKHSIGVTPETPAPQGYPPVIIDIRLYPDRVVLDFYNTGKVFDESTYEKPILDGTQEGGYGLYLIRLAADSVTYSGNGTENHWHIEKTPGPAIPAGL